MGPTLSRSGSISRKTPKSPWVISTGYVLIASFLLSLWISCSNLVLVLIPSPSLELFKVPRQGRQDYVVPRQVYQGRMSPPPPFSPPLRISSPSGLEQG